MTWWELAPRLAAGAKGRRAIWLNSRRISIPRGSTGARLPVRMEDLSAGAVTASRVVRTSNFGEIEFGATDWEVVA